MAATNPAASSSADASVGAADELSIQLSSLVAKAQSLNTHIPEGGVPHVKRDFKQLLEGSLSMVQHGLSEGMAGSTGDATSRPEYINDQIHINAYVYCQTCGCGVAGCSAVSVRSIAATYVCRLYVPR